MKENERFKYGNEIAENYLWPILPNIFLVVGTIANILSIIVFTRKEMRKFSSFCYFAMLNIVNLAFLYVTFLRSIMQYNFEIDIRTSSVFLCKTHVFFTYFLSHLSSLLLCTISIDRVISVMFIRRAKDLCTPRVAFMVTLFLIIFNFFLSSHFLVLESSYVSLKNKSMSSDSFYSDYQNLNDSNLTTRVHVEKEVLCDAKPETNYYKFLNKTWKIIDMSLYAFIPFVLMLICSVIIILRVAQQSNKFNKSSSSSNRAKKLDRSKTDELNSNTKNSQAKNVSNNTNENKFNSKTRNLAMMLIPVNVLFIIFIAPVVIAIYVYADLGEDKLTLAIVEFLSYFNFSLNFFIYFLTSSKFREEFFKFFEENFGRFKSIKKSEGLNELNSAKNSLNTNSSKCIRFICCKRNKMIQRNKKNDSTELISLTNK